MVEPQRRLRAVALVLLAVALTGCYEVTHVEESCYTRDPEGFREWAKAPEPEMWVCGNRTYYLCRTVWMPNGTPAWGCGN